MFSSSEAWRGARGFHWLRRMRCMTVPSWRTRGQERWQALCRSHPVLDVVGPAASPARGSGAPVTPRYGRSLPLPQQNNVAENLGDGPFATLALALSGCELAKPISGLGWRGWGS